MGNIGFECGGDKWPSRSNSIHDEILACYGLIQQSGIAGIPYEEANRVLHADMHAQGCVSQLLTGDFVFALFFRVPD
jgi:hypothetical protein